MRVVLDTNVYLSALLFGGPPEEILVLARAGAVTLIVSPAILDEVSAVLPRKFDWTTAQASRARREFSGLAELVIPRQTISAIREDEPDNRILKCAVAGRAEVIVTGDLRHLRPLETFRGIRIVTPREFLER